MQAELVQTRWNLSALFIHCESVHVDPRWCLLLFRQSNETERFQKSGSFKIPCHLVSESDSLNEHIYFHELARKDGFYVWVTKVGNPSVSGQCLGTFIWYSAEECHSEIFPGECDSPNTTVGSRGDPNFQNPLPPPPDLRHNRLYCNSFLGQRCRHCSIRRDLLDRVGVEIGLRVSNSRHTQKGWLRDPRSFIILELPISSTSSRFYPGGEIIG